MFASFVLWSLCRVPLVPSLHITFVHNVLRCICDCPPPKECLCVLYHMFLDAEGVGFEFLSPSEPCDRLAWPLYFQSILKVKSGQRYWFVQTSTSVQCSLVVFSIRKLSRSTDSIQTGVPPWWLSVYQSVAVMKMIIGPPHSVTSCISLPHVICSDFCPANSAKAKWVSLRCQKSLLRAA